MGYLIGYIIWGIIWGIATDRVIENKGYQESWFLWGFIFGIIAFLVALTKPENRSNRNYSDYRTSSYSSQPTPTRTIISYDREAEDKKTLSEGGWRCICGRVNSSYVGTCACGRSKTDVKRQEEENQQKESQRRQNEEELERLNAIKSLKELLDSGAITQEEYDMKKKTLLGL